MSGNPPPEAAKAATAPAEISPDKTPKQQKEHIQHILDIDPLKFDLTHWERAYFELYQHILDTTQNEVIAREFFNNTVSAYILATKPKDDVKKAHRGGKQAATALPFEHNLLERILDKTGCNPNNLEKRKSSTKKQYCYNKAKQSGRLGRTYYNIRAATVKDDAILHATTAKGDYMRRLSRQKIAGVNAAKLVSAASIITSAVITGLTFGGAAPILAVSIGASGISAASIVSGITAGIGMLSGEAMDMHGREKYVKDLRILLKDAYEVHKMANAAYKADETDKNKQTLEMANVTIKAILIGLLAYSTTLHTKGRNITTLEDALLGTKLILGAAGGYSNIGVAGVNLAAAFRLGSVATNAVHLGIKIEDDRKNVEYGNPQKGEHGRVFRVYIAKSIADTNARLPKKVSLDTKTDKWAAVELRNPHIEAFENKNTVAGGKTNSKTISANQSPPVTEKAKAHTSNVDYVTKSRASRDLGRGGAAIAMP